MTTKIDLERKLRAFQHAAQELRNMDWEEHPKLSEKYPFEKSFDELCTDIQGWVEHNSFETDVTVKLFVWSDIQVDIKREPGESEEELIERARQIALDEHPRVTWMFDEGCDPEIEED